MIKTKTKTKTKKPTLKPRPVTAVTAATFETKVLKAKGPVLVDFGAEWCGPCKMMVPVLAALAKAHPKLRVCTLDIDTEASIADTYKVTSTPALRLFVDGKIVWKQTGAVPQAKVEAGIAKFLVVGS